MAHFAELESKTDPTGFTSDTHLVVKRVVVVSNDNVTSDEHADGEAWCVNFFKGGNWKQTSYNNNFRKQYCGKGYTYDAVKNKFLVPQPYASHALDSSDDWQAPITYPSVVNDGQDPIVWTYHIKWNETKYQADNNTGWEAIKSNDEAETPTVYNWNGSAWVSE
tara:strand:+ start:433 stop:924 length:492 start_codon:yes stop_codon:yes gene_type:complete